MNDFATQLLAEEADLVRKLEAVRAMKDAYGIGGQAVTSPSVTAPKVSGRAVRSLEDRKDKFGAYGQRIIDTAIKLLPPDGDNPVQTKALVLQFQLLGVDISGNNKVNALSALLARSSKIKGYGRAGWTLSGPAEAGPSIIAVHPVDYKENEPTSGNAVGSDAVSEGGATLELTQFHSS